MNPTFHEVLPDLQVSHATVRFGGLIAVNDVSLNGRAGTITGLIGPNGAGKTTTFNACTGAVPLSSGRVELGAYRLDQHSTSVRASHGLGRTFQRMELYDSMTVSENVALGPEAAYSSRRPWSQLFSPPRQQREIRRRSESAIALCGIGPLRSRIAGDLSTGQRRLVELARAIASPFRFLLLDEPSSGLDPGETERFGQILKGYVDETGIGIVLVEHDMALVAAVCSYIYVLDFGRQIFSGTTEETLRSEIVKASYLGSEAVDADEELDQDEAAWDPYDAPELSVTRGV
ncbi:MAG TPA: ABC transporter ATP-binding protein [Acidimicrobiales bacterium]|jgi:ABC-type branched-subunit amino acid transport system ATPase component|nr:ABC transporter ATP-binding protein [Acidimicrobiales bacterium]